MLFVIFSLCVLLPWAVFFACYFWLRRAGMMRQSLAAKCAGSFLAVLSAGLGLHFQGISAVTRPIFWFFLLCMIADALLEISFVPGMLVFGAGHVCLIIALLGAGPVSWGLVIPLWLVILAAAVLLFRRELPGLGKLLPPFLIYAAILSGTLALGLSGMLRAVPSALVTGLGTLCFFVSDMMVAKMEIGNLPDRWQKPVMVLYWLALYLISFACWGA